MGNGLTGKRPLGKLERLCRERLMRDHDLARRGHPKGFWFDQEAGDFAVRWIEKYGRHHKGEWAGRPLILAEWQRENIREAFGWKRDDGSRRFRKIWWETPRKQGKTQIGGGVGLYLFVGDNEPGAEVYTTATKKEQAAICHEAARQMVRHSPDLREYVKVPKNALANLTCELLTSKMQILAADHGTLDGLSPHGDIRDEVHAWKDHELASVLDTAMGSRRQPMTLEITTAGTYDPQGVGWQHHDYAAQLLEGAFEDDRLFVYISALDDTDDPWDPSTWWKANPNLGISLKADYIAEQAGEAKRNPGKLNEFLRLHCNRWTQQVERWLSLERWQEAENPRMREDDFIGRQCVGGLDLAEKIDLCAFVLVFRAPDGGLDLVCRFWLPEAQVEIQAKKGRAFLRDWVQQGWLTATPGEVVDHGFIRREINELGQKFDIQEIGFDPRAATQIASQLGEEDGFSMVEVRQGTLTLSEPSKLLEATIIEKKVRATGAPGGANPIMRWMVGNATKRADSNLNIAPDKRRAKDKIDGVSATVTAMSRLVSGPEDSGGSYLDAGELVTA